MSHASQAREDPEGSAAAGGGVLDLADAASDEGTPIPALDRLHIWSSDATDLEDPWNLVRLALGSLAGESWRIKKALACPEEMGRLRPLPEGTTWWEQYQRTQNYDTFRSAIPFRPNTTSGCLVFVLLGDEDANLGLLADEVIALVEAFLCFRVVQRPEPMAVGAWAQERQSADGRPQLGAHFLLSHLEGSADNRSVCTIGITGTDIYPPRKFDYVTGMTDSAHRVGLFSFARYYEKRRKTLKDGYTKQADAELKRVLSMCFVKVLCRESMKLAGMRECHLLCCLMNPFPGGAPEAVADLPLELCCVCLRKLQFATQVDLLDRFARLPSLLTAWYPEETAQAWERIRSAGLPTCTVTAVQHARPPGSSGT